MRARARGESPSLSFYAFLSRWMIWVFDSVEKGYCLHNQVTEISNLLLWISASSTVSASENTRRLHNLRAPSSVFVGLLGEKAEK